MHIQSPEKKMESYLYKDGSSSLSVIVEHCKQKNARQLRNG